MNPENSRLGMAGSLAQAFIHSKLTPLIVLSALFLGAFSLLELPREEDPQINVPMFDVFVPFPGANSREIEERVINVGERKLWEIPGVEYIYSTAEPGSALFVVRFKVGTDPEESMTRIYAKVFSNLDFRPDGAGRPLIKPRSIDDVPILALTLWGKGMDGLALRRAAADIRQEISAVKNVSDVAIIGGRRRQFLVHFDPRSLARHRLTPLDAERIIQGSNNRLSAGHYDRGDGAVLVETDSLIKSADDLRQVIIGVSNGRPVRLKDVAKVKDGPDQSQRVVFTLGGAQNASLPSHDSPAVTLAVSKRRGSNATTVSEDVQRRIRRFKTTMNPALRITITRDYGKTAKEKADDLLFHMMLATFSVAGLIALALGFREAIVVLIAIPVTLSLTLLIYFLLGYTLNRITLFALIFSIGILVDDAIVVVENIHRHYLIKDGRTLSRLAVEAVAEVGNPTILATWTVMAAILPMAFVGGLMGPYMRPIPVGASFAMLFSLAVAFILSPWAFTRVLEIWPSRKHEDAITENRLDRIYRRAMAALLENPRARAWYFSGMLALLGGAMSLVFFKMVMVKMLPFDNKDEFEVILNMPESSSFRRTRAAASEISATLRRMPETRQVTAYVGTAAPYNFNGLVRHYFLRRKPYQADIEVNLISNGRRKKESHQIVRDIRASIKTIADKYGARIQLAEVPPGPPVLSTLVLEIYAPRLAQETRLAQAVRALLEKSAGIVDVDTYIPDPQPLDRLVVDRRRATLNGIAPIQITQTVRMALKGQTVGLAHLANEKEPVPIIMRLSKFKRRGLSSAEKISFISRNGTPIPLARLTRVERRMKDPPIYHKNLLRVAYVTADVSGQEESPVYAILNLRGKIQALARSMGIVLKQYYAHQPKSSLETALKWDGEWQITYEVFRDMGLAFAFALVLIYILIVYWFESFSIPLVIMAPIPLTLVGILPAHWLMGAFFTATSMIGFIAGAGIVVRNSIILVDFIQLRVREGMPLKEAVIDAGAVRFRPMLLTAAAVTVGSAVILFDPIFQGLALSLMAGEVASTLLSRTAVPVLYYLLARSQNAKT
ncbi:MAG: efflux RND transporter permease subunit [Elusimicrobiota bacterium]